MQSPAPQIMLSPSILSADFLNLERDVAKVASSADYIHVDVMDGHYTPNLTIGPGHVRALKRAFDTPLDVHLMVDNAEASVDWYLDAGADIVTVHYEAVTHMHRLLMHIKDRGAMAGVSVNPSTPIALLREIVPVADLILVMSVNPGFGGQSFIDASIRRLDELCALCQEMDARPLIEVDGGINKKTAAQVCAHGARLLVAGNAVFNTPDPATSMEAIRAAGKAACRRAD